MHLYRKILFVSLLLVCAVTNAQDQKQHLMQKWTLIILNNQSLIMAKFPQQKPYIELQKDNRFAAYVGCNQIAGSYKLIEPNVIEFSQDMISTKMACDKYFMDLETEFMNTLPKVKIWEIKDDKALNFMNAQAETLAIFTNVTIY